MSTKSTLNKLTADGWTRTMKSLLACSYYPQCDHVVLEKEGSGTALMYVYRVYADSSDYPGADESVTWQAIRLMPVTMYRVDAA